MVGYIIQQCHQESRTGPFRSAILKVSSMWSLMTSGQLQECIISQSGIEDVGTSCTPKGQKTCPKSLQLTFTKVAMITAMKLRHLLLGKKISGKGRQCTKKQRHHFTMDIVETLVFPVVMYGCERQTTKKAEHPRIDAFELWCWRRLLRVPWTARRSNQSILKEINPEYSLMLKLKLQYFGHLMRRAD